MFPFIPHSKPLFLLIPSLLPSFLAPVTFLEAPPRIMPLCLKMAYMHLHGFLEDEEKRVETHSLNLSVFINRTIHALQI